MNIRCAFCQTPYTLSRLTMLDALQEMDAHNLSHYDAHCPRCRRATQIPRRRMEMFMPNWRDELKQFEAEMKAHPQHEAPLPSSEPVAIAEAESKPEPQAAKEPKSTAKPAEKTASRKAKPAPKKTPAAKKTATSSSKRKGTAKKSK